MNHIEWGILLPDETVLVDYPDEHDARYHLSSMRGTDAEADAMRVASCEVTDGGDLVTPWVAVDPEPLPFVFEPYKYGVDLQDWAGESVSVMFGDIPALIGRLQAALAAHRVGGAR